jgi:hypothetical protein
MKQRSITGWKKTVQILKEGCAVGPHIVFADESGFQLIPSVVRAWVRRGKLPSFVPSSVPSATFAPRGGSLNGSIWQCELFFVSGRCILYAAQNRESGVHVA